MADHGVLNQLAEIGLSEREAKIYLALLDWPGASAVDLQRLALVPRSKIYEILEKMVSRGYCVESNENGRKYYRATQPTSLNTLLETRWTTEFNQRRDVAKHVLSHLQEHYKASRPSGQTLEKIEVIRNKTQINQKYIELLESTHHTLESFNRSPYACVDPAVLTQQEAASQLCIERKVRIRTIYMREESHWEWLYPSILRSIEEGEEARIAAYLPLKMYISDGRRVMLALPAFGGKVDAEFTMVILEDSGVCESYRMLFETLWESSQRIDREEVR